MQIVDRRYASLTIEQAKKLKLTEICVELMGKQIPLSELYVLDGHKVGDPITDEKWNENARRIFTFADFLESLDKHRVFTKDRDEIKRNLAGDIDLFADKLIVPNFYESISMNHEGATIDEEVPYGLKRVLKVDAKDWVSGKYLYAEIDGKWDFVEADKVYYVEETTQHFIREPGVFWSSLADKILFDEKGRSITSIYTEYTYDFPSTEIQETIDFDTMQKVTYTRKTSGEFVPVSTDLHVSISDQNFEKVTVPDEKKPGKTKEVSRLKVKNFEASHDGEYFALNVGSEIRMVTLSELRDETGAEITDLASMVGKPLHIVRKDLPDEVTEAVTYEQANVRYNPIMTYQATEGDATETSCLRLKNGRYVRELSSVQPISYALAPDDSDDFDKYLVRQIVGSTTKYVVVDKDYFTRHGTAGYDFANKKKLKKCNYKSKNCKVLQTTSKGASVESCSIVGEITMGTDTLPQTRKEDEYSAFLENYKKGDYQVKEVFVGDKLEEIAEGKNRYEYTDEAYFDDPASELHEYQALGKRNLTLKNGKIVGGAKYSMGKATAKAYGTWGKWLMYGYATTAVAGIFIPVVGPIVCAAYGVGMIAALPTIPIVTGITAVVKNRTGKKTFKDKTEHDRKMLEREVAKEISELYTQRSELTPEQFADKYSQIMNKVASFSQTTENSALVVKNGEAVVTDDNANLANEYRKKYNSIVKEIEKLKKRLKKVSKKDGTAKPKHQAEYDILKADLATKEAELESMKNITIGQSYAEDERREKLERRANDMRLACYVEQNPDEFVEWLVTEGIEESLARSLISSVQYSVKDSCILIDGVPLDSTEDEITFEDAKKQAWLKVQELLQKTKLDEIHALEPLDENITGVSELVADLEAELATCQEMIAELEEMMLDEALVDYSAIETISATIVGFETVFTDFANVDFATLSGDELSTKTAEIQAQKAELENFHGSVVEIIKNITAIAVAQTEFDQVMESLKEAIGELEVSEQAEHLDNALEFEMSVVETVQDAKAFSNMDTLLEDLANSLEIINNITTETEQEMYAVRSLIYGKTIESCIARIEELQTNATAKHEEVKDKEVVAMVVGLDSAMSSDVEIFETYKTQAKETKKLSVARELKDKAEEVFKLVDITTEAVTIFEDVMLRKASKDTIRNIGGSVRDLIPIIKVTEANTLEELKQKVSDAQGILSQIRIENEADKTLGDGKDPVTAGPEPVSPDEPVAPAKPKTPRKPKTEAEKQADKASKLFQEKKVLEKFMEAVDEYVEYSTQTDANVKDILAESEGNKLFRFVQNAWKLNEEDTLESLRLLIREMEIKLANGKSIKKSHKEMFDLFSSFLAEKENVASAGV